MGLSFKIRAWSFLRDSLKTTYELGIQQHEPAVAVVLGDEELHCRRHKVAASGIIKLFDIATDLGDFDCLIVEADQDGQIQFANKSAANFFTLQTRVKIPFIVAGSGSLDSTGSVGAFDGSSDPIERVYWKNTSSVTAHVTIHSGT